MTRRLDWIRIVVGHSARTMPRSCADSHRPFVCRSPVRFCALRPAVRRGDDFGHYLVGWHDTLEDRAPVAGFGGNALGDCSTEHLEAGVAAKV